MNEARWIGYYVSSRYARLRHMPLAAAITFVIAVVASGASATSINTATSVKDLTDDEISAFAKDDFMRLEWMHNTVILGLHNGAKVIAEHPCSDLCPIATKRIVRYDIDLNDCETVDGRVVSVTVPLGITVTTKDYCVPRAVL